MKLLGETAASIINEVKGGNRVIYDVTSKPLGPLSGSEPIFQRLCNSSTFIVGQDPIGFFRHCFQSANVISLFGFRSITTITRSALLRFTEVKLQKQKRRRSLP
jgi:hypothetical protein